MVFLSIHLSHMTYSIKKKIKYRIEKDIIIFNIMKKTLPYYEINNTVNMKIVKNYTNIFSTIYIWCNSNQILATSKTTEK